MMSLVIFLECSESEATLVAGVESDSNSDDCSSSCSYSDTEDETGLISDSEWESPRKITRTESD